MTYSVPSTERLLNAKRFSRLPPKSVPRQEALWQDSLREGSVRALCQEGEYNSGGLTCHLREAVRARNFIGASLKKTDHGLNVAATRGKRNSRDGSAGTLGSCDRIADADCFF